MLKTYLTTDWHVPNVKPVFPTQDEAIEYERENNKDFGEYLSEAIKRDNRKEN